MTTSRALRCLTTVLLVVESWLVSSIADASLSARNESSEAVDVAAAVNETDVPSTSGVPGPDFQRIPGYEGRGSGRNMGHRPGLDRSLAVEALPVYDTLEGGAAATADEEPGEGADQEVLEADVEIEGQWHHYYRRTDVARSSPDTDHLVARGPPPDKIRTHDTSNLVDPAGEPGQVRRAIPGSGSELVTPRGAGVAADDAPPYATRAEKLDHIFVPKHNLDHLVRHFGSRQAVVEQMLRRVSGRTPESGVFEIPFSVGGQTVVVRGAVVDGVVKLGTASEP